MEADGLPEASRKPRRPFCLSQESVGPADVKWVEARNARGSTRRRAAHVPACPESCPAFQCPGNPVTEVRIWVSTSFNIYTKFSSVWFDVHRMPCNAATIQSREDFFFVLLKFPMSCSHPREQSAGRTSNNATRLNPNFSYLIQRDFSLAFFPVQSQPNIYIFYLSSMLQSSHFVNFLEIFY